MARIDPTKLNLEEKVVQINRVAKVVKGGRRFSFSAVVVVGDRQRRRGRRARQVERGSRGHPQGRGGCQEASDPGSAGGQPPSRTRCSHDYGASHVMLKPASAGTGVIAGGSVRSVVEAAGIRDLLQQVDGQQQPGQRGARHASRPWPACARPTPSPRDRGKTAEQLLGKRGAEAARRPHEYVERPAPAFPSGGPRGR